MFLMNDAGDRLASRRLPEGVAGIRQLHKLIAGQARDPAEAVIRIDRGLWVDALIAAGYQVFAINPLAAARYHGSEAKSDPADAKLLAGRAPAIPTAYAVRCGSTTRQHRRRSGIWLTVTR